MSILSIKTKSMMRGGKKLSTSNKRKSAELAEATNCKITRFFSNKDTTKTPKPVTRTVTSKEDRKASTVVISLVSDDEDDDGDGDDKFSTAVKYRDEEKNCSEKDSSCSSTKMCSSQNVCSTRTDRLESVDITELDSESCEIEPATSLPKSLSSSKIVPQHLPDKSLCLPMEESSTQELDNNSNVADEALCEMPLEQLEQEFNIDRTNDSESVKGLPQTGATEAKESSDEETTTHETEDYVPYYLEKFTLIIQSVIDDEFYAHLINEEDLKVVEKFLSLPVNSQKLYIRLFQRKLKWHRHAKIHYPKIASDLTSCLEELVQAGLLMDKQGLVDLSDVLRVLTAPDTRILAKSLRLPASAGTTQQALNAAILRHSQQTNVASFFIKPDGNSTPNVILKRAQDLLGACYRVVSEPRAVFLRLLMLFAVHRTLGDDEQNAQQQLFEMLMLNIGKLKYPEYTVDRHYSIFRDRASLKRRAVQLDTELSDTMEKKDWEKAEELYQAVKTEAQTVLNDTDIQSHDRALPSFLRVFTEAAVCVRSLSRGVELLQFEKHYEEAVSQLYMLLTQELYHADYRGRWYDRLALNLDFHLKQHDKALEVISAALSDPSVQVGHRYSLWQRAHKLCHGSNKKLHKKRTEFDTDVMAAVQDARKVFIEGRLLTRSIPGAGAVYVHGAGDQTGEFTMMTRVEDVALAHYRDHGHPQGVHGEGTTFATLFFLFFWDVVFMSGVPGAFYNSRQTWPLDLYTEHFYTARQDAIQSRLDLIHQADTQFLEAEVERRWSEHEGTQCGGLSWTLFTGADHAQGLVRCMGGVVLAAIFSRMARQMRYVRSGVPDLVVWNPDSATFKVVEVKGPGDRLSSKQVLWLDYLLSIGVQAEVCHVQAVGAKKLRTR